MPAPRIKLADPRLGEEEIDAVAQVMRSGVLTDGPATVEFERRMAERHQTKHGVAFANGTMALHTIYLALGIGTGDEVIVPSLTFISSATSIVHAGATPVFADIAPDTFNIDPTDVARKLTPRTKAILAVHYGGQAADLDELRAIADESGAVLIEDAAEAHGATYRDRPVGSHGRAAMFSFTPTKNITTGEGGMVTTNDGGLAHSLRVLRNQGQASRYCHDRLGHNGRLSEVQAAIGAVQMNKLDDIVARKQSNAACMAARLAEVSGVQSPIVRGDRDHVYMLYTVLLDGGVDRDAVLDAMLGDGIEARIYFPPAHRQPVFAGIEAHLPVTDDIAARILSIPFHVGLTESGFAYVVDRLQSALAAQC